VTDRRPRLAFVSPLFLFPNDAGGKIRTTNVLRGLKGGAFDVTLLSPATAQQRTQWASELDGVCDRFVSWQPPRVRARWQRGMDLFSALPVNVAADRVPAAMRAVHDALASESYDVAVFDFVHAAVLRPSRIDAATVCFTHNVESEIFARHAQQAANPLMRRVWASQQRKMERFERDSLRAFDTVIAVSERDAQQFAARFGLPVVRTIPTGVDLDFFSWREPPSPGPGSAPTVVFTGSMNWDANVDGVAYFLEQVWPRVVAEVPVARFVIVGRDAPASLQERARRSANVTMTGFVDDVRPHVHAAQVFVIPLRVGGGTRIKAFEAMAMGCPVVSTSIGIEGLDVRNGEQFLCRDDPSEFAQAVVQLIGDASLRRQLSSNARRRMEASFGHQVVARAFEAICQDALNARRSSGSQLTAEKLLKQ
jgi:glycosyltransferase involved in cell wall biosynthesis